MRRAAALTRDIAAAAPPASAEELVRLRHQYLARQLEALRARVTMLSGRKLRFDEESKALYDAVAPVHTASEFDGALSALGRAPARAGNAAAALRRVPQPLRDPARAARRDVQGGDRGLPQPHAAARDAAAGRELHRRVRHEQELERLQLVSGQLSQPDPGEHRSADLRRPRHRPGVPRGLSRTSRLQRAAREAPGARSRLDGVFGLSAVLAAVAHRRGHGELRHRGGISARRAAGVRARR